ncbi:MAG: stress response protein ysnf, partial [Limisphaerales bacterium]
MAYEKVVALYETDASARAAIKTLRSAGYSADDISLIQNEGEAERAGLHEPGIWQRMFGKDLEHHEAAVLSQSLREGSAIVVVRVHESEAPRVIGLLDSHKPVDVMDRAKAYGLIGATGTTAAAVKGTATETLKTAATAPTRLSDEQVMRLAEEQLNVGKRVVDAGFTRVRRFVV